MEIKVVFEAESIVRGNVDAVQVYPPSNADVPIVGSTVTGKYVIPCRKHISGEYTFSRTTTYIDSCGRVHGIGTIFIDMNYRGVPIGVTTSYIIRSTDPNVIFSVDEVITPITSALVDGKLAQGKLHFVPIDGGKSYKVCLVLEPVIRCPPPPECMLSPAERV